MTVKQLLTAASVGDRIAWKGLVEEYAPRVWETASILPNFGSALDAGSVVFLRLADHCREVAPEDLDDWLAATTDRVLLEAEAARWRTPVPPFEQYEGVPSPLLDVALQAIDIRSEGPPVVQPVYDSTVGLDLRPAEARGVTVPWRAPEDAEVLPVPEAVWRGVYQFGEIEIDLTLLAADERRIVGTAHGLGGGQAWLRPRSSVADLDERNRFRIAPVPEGPVSVALSGPNGSFVTEWRTL